MLPLAGQRVVVTRAPHQAPELTRLLEAAGAEVVAYPTIAIRPVSGEERRVVERAARDLAAGQYAGVVFTSANAVEHFAPRELGGAVAFAVGEPTARALAARGIAALLGTEASGAGLVPAVLARFGGDLRGKRFLLPRAREGRPELQEGLRAAGALVDLVVTYETAPLPDGPPLPAGRIDWVLFMSPSAALGFAARARLPNEARVACIGATTAEAARRAGLRVDVVPTEASSAALVQAIATFA